MLGPPLLPRNLEASVRDLSSTKPAVRASATADLVRHAQADEAVRERALPLLTARLKEDEHPQVRAAAAVGLGDLRANDAVTALLVAVEDDDPHVRQMSLNAIGEIGDARALPRLRRALKDGRPEVRYQSIIAFARVADRAGSQSTESSEVDDALFAAASDDDDAIRHIALRIAEERLDNGHEPEARLLVRARAFADLRGPGAGSPHVALAAAILLAKVGDEGGRDLVVRVVRGEKIGGHAPDKEDERAAVELAGELGLEELVGHLERRTWGVLRFVRDTCPFHARIALARMGHDRAKKEILDELASSRREVLSGAVVSAGRARMSEARGAIAKFTALVVDPELTREALERLDGGIEGMSAAPVPQSLLGMRYRASSKRGHVESWFFKATEPGGRRAIWLRTTIFARPPLSPVAEAWAIAFDRHRGHVAVKSTVALGSARFATDDVDVDVDGCRLSLDHARGALSSGRGTLTWDLAVGPPLSAPIVHFASLAMYDDRVPPSSKLVTPLADARASGELAVDRGGGDVDLWEIGDWPAMVGHNWGRGHAELYAWTHCNAWDVAGLTFEAISARVRLGPLLSPMATSAFVRWRGQRWDLSRVSALRKNRGAISLRRWEMTGDHDGLKVACDVAAENDDIVGLHYLNPVGPITNCLSTSLARARLELHLPGGETVTATSRAAALEIGTIEPDHGIRMYL